ncbi:hypothetical protein [Dyadobacter sp.]|uniref:hypothetical protein n=1 Tax=Dyadobacter sp. TaxID=1914288 RepID=UPI003F720BD3
MIQLDFDWTDTISLITLAVAIVAALVALVWKIFAFKNRPISGSRTALKLALNVVLWLSVIAFILQPQLTWKARVTTGILAGGEVPAAFLRHLQDSLHRAELVKVEEIERSAVDTLLLVGTRFPSRLFTSLPLSTALPVVKWIPFNEPDRLVRIQWKGILRKGEMQEVSGRLVSTRKQVLKLAFGRNTLDSTMLNKGENHFKLRFPAFAEGRTMVTLGIDGLQQDTLRFFARPATPLAARFILDSPDFENRTLAAWLGKNGHAVVYDVSFAKDLKSSVKINSAKAPDLIITNAANANSGGVKKALESGASVIFIGLTDPESEIRRINEVVGARFQVRKISNEPALKVLPQLDALPYQFVTAANQIKVTGMPVVIEKRRGNVGVSLLNETFPLQLSGDSATYQQVWDTILAHLQPAGSHNLEIEAPIIEGAKARLDLNNFPALPHYLPFGSDTLFLTKSPFNSSAGSAAFIPVQSGWVTLQDSVPAEIFVENDSEAAQLARLSAWVNAYENQDGIEGKAQSASRATTRALPEWAWYLWLMICFAALWIEEKFS